MVQERGKFYVNWQIRLCILESLLCSFGCTYTRKTTLLSLSRMHFLFRTPARQAENTSLQTLLIATCGPVLEFSKCGFQESCLLVLPSSSCLKLGHNAWKPISYLAVSRTKPQAEDGRAERTERAWILSEILKQLFPPQLPTSFLFMGWNSEHKYRHTLDWLEPLDRCVLAHLGTEGRGDWKEDETRQPQRPA